MYHVLFKIFMYRLSIIIYHFSLLLLVVMVVTVKVRICQAATAALQMPHQLRPFLTLLSPF